MRLDMSMQPRCMHLSYNHIETRRVADNRTRHRSLSGPTPHELDSRRIVHENHEKKRAKIDERSRKESRAVMLLAPMNASSTVQEPAAIGPLNTQFTASFDT